MKSNGPKKSIEQRTEIESRILMLPGGFLLGVIISPIVWQFVEVTSWKEALLVSAVVGLVFGLVFALFPETKAAKIFSSVLKILNPH